MSTIDLLQSLGIIGSLVFAGISGIAVLRQLRVYTRTLRWTMIVNMQDRLDRINESVMEHPSLAISDVSEGIAHSVIVQEYYFDRLFTLFGQAYVARHDKAFHDKPLLEKAEWDAWVSTMRKAVQMKSARDRWAEVREEFPTPFRQFMDSLVSTTHPSDRVE